MCARLVDVSIGAYLGVAVPVVLASVVLACVTVVSVISFNGVVSVLFGFLAGEFSTCVYDKDVNKHAQQVRARIAWQVGNFRRCLFLVFILLLWHMFLTR